MSSMAKERRRGGGGGGGGGEDEDEDDAVRPFNHGHEHVADNLLNLLAPSVLVGEWVPFGENNLEGMAGRLGALDRSVFKHHNRHSHSSTNCHSHPSVPSTGRGACSLRLGRTRTR